MQLSGASAEEDLQLKACLSHGKRLIPTLSAHFDPYSDYPLPPPPISGDRIGSTQKEREENREEMSLGRVHGGHVFTINLIISHSFLIFYYVFPCELIIEL